MAIKIVFGLSLLAAASQLIFGYPANGVSYGDHELRTQRPIVKTEPERPKGDGEVTADAVFSGIGTFAHLPFAQCWANATADFDIAFIGAPFDTGTSYR
jgi:agmatinase